MTIEFRFEKNMTVGQAIDYIKQRVMIRKRLIHVTF